MATQQEETSTVKLTCLEWIFEFLAGNNYTEAMQALKGELDEDVAEAVMSPSLQRSAIFSARLIVDGRVAFLGKFLRELPESSLRHAQGFDEVLAATKVQAVVEEIRKNGFEAGVEFAETMDLAADQNDPIPNILPHLKAGNKAQKAQAHKKILELFPVEAYTRALKTFLAPLESSTPLPFLERLVGDIKTGTYVPDDRVSLPALRAAAGGSKTAWEDVVRGNDTQVSKWLSSVPKSQAAVQKILRSPVAPLRSIPSSSAPTGAAISRELHQASQKLKLNGPDPLPGALKKAADVQQSVAHRHNPVAAVTRSPIAARRSVLPLQPVLAPQSKKHQEEVVVEDDIEPEDAYGAALEDDAPPSPSRPVLNRSLQSPRASEIPSLRASPVRPAPSKKRAGDDQGSAYNAHEDPSVERNAIPGGQRKRRRWSEAEEVTLLDGVRQHGIGAWVQVLNENKSTFFDRTGVDLKDKWRNMQAKLNRPT